MNGHGTQFDPEGSDAPEALRADLTGLYGRGVTIPAAADAAIITAAHRHGARVRRARALFRWTGGIAAAAAMVLVAIRLIPSRPPAFDPSHRVTILDAFSLA